MPTAYPIIGDVNKPFHLPECECEQCETWRIATYDQQEKDRGLPVHRRRDPARRHDQ